MVTLLAELTEAKANIQALEEVFAYNLLLIYEIS